MSQKSDALIEQLNSPLLSERLGAIARLKIMTDKGELPRPEIGEDVNNHIHSTYSFSPYSPTKAVWRAHTAGLCTAGIMDHDSISGAAEFIEAGSIVGIPTTIGMEMRVDFSSTPLAGRRINNPDQKGIAYMALHGIPHTQIEKVSAFMAPYRQARNKRNEQIIRRINGRFDGTGIRLDFARDVLPLSNSYLGGGVTERHVLFALAHAIVAKCGRGTQVVDFITKEMNLKINARQTEYLSDISNVFYEYDLLNILKSDASSVYVDASDECMDVHTAIDFAKEIGAIAAYAYLGDVGESVTGDKRAQTFEDSYLDELFDTIVSLGFNAVTYMPSRNTEAQLTRLRNKCVENSLFQISGEDINSPRQLFICKALQNPAYHNLVDATWALIGHERAATESLSNGMFSAETLAAMPSLDERIAYYGKIGRQKI